MLKIGLVVDIKLDSGGALGMCLSKIHYFQKIKNKNFIIVTTYKSTFDFLRKNNDLEVLLYNKESKLNRVHNFFSKKFNFLLSNFEKFLNSKKIKKIFFLSPSYLNIDLKNLEYIYTIWDLSHLEKNLQKLTEHNISIRKIRDKSYEKSAKKAKSIIIGTKENKIKFSDFYNCQLKKINVLKFPPYLCVDKKEEDFLNLSFKNYLLYPAQYWEHKNHEYLINFFSDFMNNKFVKNISLVCTGFDKGNLSKLKKIIIEKKLEKKVLLLDYVDDKKLVWLYKNCIAVVFPSLIGSHSFPLYEAFYFKKPIFYNKDILSKEFADYVYLIDIRSTKSLFNQFLNFLDNDRTNTLVRNAELKFKHTFNEIKIVNKLDRIINSF